MTKPTEWSVGPAKTQISLGIRPVWSESSLSTWRNIGPSATHWAHCEDSDQTGPVPRLIRVFTGLTCHFVGVFSWVGSIYHIPEHDKTNKMTCAPIDISDQPGHLPSLISLPLMVTKDHLMWTAKTPRLIWVFAGCIGHFVGFIVLWLTYLKGLP